MKPVLKIIAQLIGFIISLCLELFIGFITYLVFILGGPVISKIIFLCLTILGIIWLIYYIAVIIKYKEKI